MDRDHIAYRNGECTITDDKIQCDIGQSLSNPDLTIEADMDSGHVKIVNEDVEVETNTRGNVKVTGGSIQDEYRNPDGRITKSFRNREMLEKDT